MKMFFSMLVILQICAFFATDRAWDLTGYNVSPNYYIASIATYANRAFLALPRSACYNNQTYPTLVEVSWREQKGSPSRPKTSFFHNFQEWNNCDSLQDAVSLDMEHKKARLWILDKGNTNCLSKVVIYDLFQKINYTANTPDGIDKHKLNTLIIDTDSKANGPRAFIGSDGEGYLLVFSLMEFQWRQIFLQEPYNFRSISTKYLAIARREELLYVTGGHEREIFSLDLSSMRLPYDEIEKVNCTYRGDKLGNSTGLLADLKKGVYYYIARDFVVVRWNTKYHSKAEHYNIIAQSYDQLPYVSQLFTGPQNGIWAIANLGDPKICSISPNTLEKRLVKLLKYNKF